MIRSVLIVDDEPGIRDILRAELEFHKYMVKEAENGEQALKVTKSFPIDVVISDIRMPVMGGKDFLKKIKEQAVVFPAFYFISGYPDLTLEEAMALGARGLFKKPFQLKELVKKIVDDFTLQGSLK